MVIADDPKQGNRAGWKTLAHELVHALGYEKHDNQTPDNLMNDRANGGSLTSDQIHAIWENLNTNGEHLLSMTCDI